MKKASQVCVSICVVISLLITSFSRCIVYAASKEASNTELTITVLGLESSGDCILIKYGDVEILVDSAETKESRKIIIEHMESMMENDSQKEWDYMIFTHPDEDHIGNAVSILEKFYGEGSESKEWSIGHIIDFDMEDAPIRYFKADPEKYREARDKLVAEKEIDYFKASELTSDNKTKTYSLGDNCTLTILYNYYDNYDVIKGLDKKNELTKAQNRNDISVCFLLTYNNQKILFTGDLEEDGEKELVNNHGDMLKNVTFFKAAHHGSNNANSKEFLDVIRPEIVSITKMNSEDTAIDRFMKYTDYIYPTYVRYEGKDYPLFKTETYTFNGNQVNVNTELNGEKQTDAYPSILDAMINYEGTELPWYQKEVEKNNLDDVIYIFVLEEGTPEYSNCSLVKYGHYDILIDCGSSDVKSIKYVEKLNDYVRDGCIEYVVVSHYHLQSFSQLIGDGGVFSNFEIDNLIDTANTNFKEDKTAIYYNSYISEADKLNRYSIDSRGNKSWDVLKTQKFSITVMGNGLNDSQKDENNYSLLTLVQFSKYKLLFVGDLVNYNGVLDTHSDELKNVDFLRLSGSSVSVDLMEGIDEFLEKSNPQHYALGSPLGYRIPNGRPFYGEENCKELLTHVKKLKCSNVLFTGYVEYDGNSRYYYSQNGDLTYCFFNNKDKQVKVHSSIKDDSGKLVYLENSF